MRLTPPLLLPISLAHALPSNIHYHQIPSSTHSAPATLAPALSTFYPPLQSSPLSSPPYQSFEGDIPTSGPTGGYSHIDINAGFAIASTYMIKVQKD